MQMLGSPVIRAHQHAAGVRKAKGGQRSQTVALGRSRGGFSTKLHIIRADGRGLPLAFALIGGERHDLKAVPELLDGEPLGRSLIVAKRSYDAASPCCHCKHAIINANF